MQCTEHVIHVGIKFPYAGFGEVIVGEFEKIIAIEILHTGRYLIEDTVDQISPPAFVIVFARSPGCGTCWHLFPHGVKGRIQGGGIKFEAEPFPDERIMIPDTPGQMNERAGGIEENCPYHSHQSLIALASIATAG